MEPADSSHPYGHGKMETLGTVFMSVVVALTGIWIVWEGIRRLRAGSVPRPGGTGVGRSGPSGGGVAAGPIYLRMER